MKRIIKYIKLNGIIPMKTYIEYVLQGWLFKESLSLLKKLLIKQIIFNNWGKSEPGQLSGCKFFKVYQNLVTTSPFSIFFTYSFLPCKDTFMVD
jgi:hypothetical protein